MAAKPSIPKGTRDFSPVEMAKRNYIFNTIRDVYHLYGFQQIETPSMEMLSTLMGKYGEEGDKLLFKIQNSGDYFSGLTDEELLSRNAAKLAGRNCYGVRLDGIVIAFNGITFCLEDFNTEFPVVRDTFRCRKRHFVVIVLLEYRTDIQRIGKHYVRRAVIGLLFAAARRQQGKGKQGGGN